MQLQLFFAACLLLLAGAGPVRGSSAATSPPPNATLTIRLGLVWDTEKAGQEFLAMTAARLPSISSACPGSSRARNTVLDTSGVFSITTLPTTADLKSVVQSLRALNFLFFGLKRNSITQVLESINVPTAVAEFPVMQTHAVAPMPQSLLLDALMKTIVHRISESQYPDHPSNFRVALFFDSSVTISDMYPLFTYFSEGVLYFHFNAATLERDLLRVRLSQIFNIVAILLDADEGRLLRDTAFSLGMFSSRYRWFLHGPRLINDGSGILSKNITSLEFGRIRDALAQGIWSTAGALIHDLLSIWTPFLRYYICEEKSPVNRTVNGFTGRFHLHPDGSATRLNWHMAVYSGVGTSQEQVGVWASDGRFEMLSRKDVAPGTAEILAELQAQKFRVVTLISPPYTEYAEGVTDCSPCQPSQLTGMYIEICKILLGKMGITDFEFVMQPDNAFGVGSGSQWNGIIQSVMNGRARLGCAPITINTDRFEVVDFSRVIHSSRISLLFKKRATDPLEQAFQFILPLHHTIWLSIIGVLFLVALVLFVMNKIAPNKGANFNLYNSFFFTFAEVVQGTSGTTPTQISGRIVVSFFWFFTLFLFLSYVANYAVFRTLDGVRQEVTSIETLIENRDYDSGSVNNTVTDSLLKKSAYLQMQQVYLLMTETFPNGSVADLDAGLNLIKNPKRNFVLINDNLQNQYLRDRGCDLISAGEFYDLKNALIMPKGNDYAQLVNEHLLNMTKNITGLKDTFFSMPSEEKDSCYDGTFSSAVRHYTPKDAWPVKTGALTLADTDGIAVINLLGCFIALALAGIERGIGRLQMRRSDARRKRQVDRATELKFKRPTSD